VAADYVLKVADFGLTRNIPNHDYYRKTTDVSIPIIDPSIATTTLRDPLDRHGTGICNI